MLLSIFYYVLLILGLDSDDTKFFGLRFQIVVLGLKKKKKRETKHISSMHLYDFFLFLCLKTYLLLIIIKIVDSFNKNEKYLPPNLFIAMVNAYQIRNCLT